MSGTGVQQLRESIASRTSQCVRCGLCLPVCPTYAVSKCEADSPRGRLAVMAAVASAELEVSTVTAKHLDQCLHCGACQDVCPASVSYNSLIDDAKHLLAKEKHIPPVPRMLRYFVLVSAMRRISARLVRWYQRCGLQKIIRKTGMLRWLRLSGLESMLPGECCTRCDKACHQHLLYRISHKYRQGHQKLTVSEKPTQNLYLFRGCVAEIVDQNTIADTVYVLEKMGFTVHSPSWQGCCGAIFQHNGHPEEAAKCRHINSQAFCENWPVLGCASGCSAQWRSFYGNDANRYYDIQEFLWQNRSMLLSARWQDCPQDVLLHVPCTMRSSPKLEGLAKKILNMLMPSINILDFPANSSCCGAAGTNMLRYPSLSATLLSKAISSFEKQHGNRTGLILTSNVGCAMHFRRILHLRGWQTTVMHPISLLAQKLR